MIREWGNRKWENGKMGKWENGKMGKWGNRKWENGKMGNGGIENGGIADYK